MTTQRRRSLLSYIPGYSQNAVLQLIVISGVAFCMLGMIYGIILIVYNGNLTNFNTHFIANVGLPSLANFKEHWWTIFTYGWFHFSGFWELLSDMLWLYMFGSVVQMLVGYKQVIPLFAYSIIAGGIVYMLAQLLPGGWGKIPVIIALLGPRAALMAMAAAAITLTPKYRFYFTETFSIPLMLVAGIFGALMIIGSGFYLPIIFMLLAGAGSGYAYIKLLQAGYRPGAWMYALSEKAQGLVTPRGNTGRRSKKNYPDRDMFTPKKGVSQSRIDEILDKINQKGYNSLSAEEKEILMKAGKEN